MAENQEYPELDDHAGNSMLQEAVEALRKGDKRRARDLLTRLLKVDQKNATYWIWLSAVVETSKESLYCLRMALNLDPGNESAKRGLVLLGALPPDDTVPPFPVNRPRSWEDKLIVPKDSPDRKRGWANPVTRALLVMAIAVVAVGLAIGAWILVPHEAAPVFFFPSNFRLPSRTSDHTPTGTPLVQTPTPTLAGPTPLSYLLQASYTPTPRYIMTEHPITSRSAFESALRFMDAGDYANAMVLFEQAIDLEGETPDIDYYIGEAYRAQGDYRSARAAYQQAINLDPTFAPAFLGRARANLGLNPEAAVSNDLDTAISLDPRYAEAYIERGAYQVDHAPYFAIADLETALEINPESALAYYYLAEAQLLLNRNQAAIASAQQANRIDMTLLPVYLILGRAHMAVGEPAQAIGPLQTYALYEYEDVPTMVLLGTAYRLTGNYEEAVRILTRAVSANYRNGEAYTQRGLAYLAQQKDLLAVDDLETAIIYSPGNFEAQMGLALAYDRTERPGEAYIQAEGSAYPLARTNEQRAEVYYWMATFLTELGDDLSLQAAATYWTKLVALPAESMPDEWRTAGMSHLGITPTFTRTVAPTRIPSRTATASVTPTP